MDISIDLHIHTALSPCALEEMTPNNIVNMACLNNLDVIAIADHNSAENVAPVWDLAKATDLIVLPGIEVETREEIHVVCLFSDLNRVYNMQSFIYSNLLMKKNLPHVFGQQLVFNKEDDVIGQCDKLLSFASKIPLNQLVDKVNDYGGVAIPAHIDRPSYSLISNLGFIPPDLKVRSLEVSQYASKEDYQKKYRDYQVVQSSDAHELGHIGICQDHLQVATKSAQEIIHQLKIGHRS